MPQPPVVVVAPAALVGRLAWIGEVDDTEGIDFAGGHDVRAVADEPDRVDRFTLAEFVDMADFSEE